MLRNRSRDFHKGEVITAKLIAEEQIDDHHLFPKAWLDKHRPGTPEVDRECVLNRTLIDRITNILIGDRAPSDYLAEIEAKLGAGPLAAILDSHLLPADPTGPLWRDDFPAFLAAREAGLAQEIARVTS